MSEIFCVYFGPSFVMFKADNVGDLKKQFSTNEAQSKVWRYDLAGHELDIAKEYCGHDLAQVKAQAPEQILPNDWKPTKKDKAVYLLSTPTVDFEAHRAMLHAEIKAENERRAAEEAAQKEGADKEAAATAKKAPWPV